MKNKKFIALSVIALTALAACNGGNDVKKNKVDLKDEETLLRLEEKIKGAMDSVSNMDSIGTKLNFDASAYFDISQLFFKENGKESKARIDANTSLELDVEADGLFGDEEGLYAHAKLLNKNSGLKLKANIADVPLFMERDDEGNIVYVDEAKTNPKLREINLDYALESSGDSIEAWYNKGVAYFDVSNAVSENTVNSVQEILNDFWAKIPEIALITEMEKAPEISSYAKMLFNEDAKYYYETGEEFKEGLLDAPTEEDNVQGAKELLELITDEESSIGEFLSIYEYTNGDFEFRFDITTEMAKSLIPDDEEPEIGAVSFKEALKELNGSAYIKIAENCGVKEMGASGKIVANGKTYLGDMLAYVDLGAEVNLKYEYDFGKEVTRPADEAFFEKYTDIAPIIAMFTAKK